MKAVALFLVGAVLVTGAEAQGSLTFDKVVFYQHDGEEERERDARPVLDPVAKMLVFAADDAGEEHLVYARVPYANVTKVVYEKSSHRRYTAGVLVSPLLFFTKGKKHWLTIEFTGVPGLPQGFVYARLHKDNFREILSALRAGTGIEVEEHIEN